MDKPIHKKIMNDDGTYRIVTEEYTYEEMDGVKYRWKRSGNREQKTWYRYDERSKQWKHFDIIGNVMKLKDDYHYCVTCGWKGVRISFMEASDKCRELGIHQDNPEKVVEYDKKKYAELDIMSEYKPPYDFHDKRLIYLWECSDGKMECEIKSLKDFTKEKKQMIQRRVELGLSIDDLDTRTKNKLKKEKKMMEEAKKNEEMWKKFW